MEKMKALKMRVFVYEDNSGYYEKTGQQILDEYWEHWKDRMNDVGKKSLVSEDKCIEDWIVNHWAWEKKDER